MDNATKLARQRQSDQEIDRWIQLMRKEPLTEKRVLYLIKDLMCQMGFGAAKAVYNTGNEKLALKFLEDIEELEAGVARANERLDSGLTLSEMPLANIIPINQTLH